jgi:hypothetical protein
MIVMIAGEFKIAGVILAIAIVDSVRRRFAYAPMACSCRLAFDSTGLNGIQAGGNDGYPSTCA